MGLYHSAKHSLSRCVLSEAYPAPIPSPLHPSPSELSSMFFLLRNRCGSFIPASSFALHRLVPPRTSLVMSTPDMVVAALVLAALSRDPHVPLRAHETWLQVLLFPKPRRHHPIGGRRRQCGIRVILRRGEGARPVHVILPQTRCNVSSLRARALPPPRHLGVATRPSAPRMHPCLGAHGNDVVSTGGHS